MKSAVKRKTTEFDKFKVPNLVVTTGKDEGSYDEYREEE